MKIHWN